MTPRILDYSFQLNRLFSDLIFDYDNLDNANGKYDIVYIHREGIQDEFDEVRKYLKPTSKIICDVSTESGNIDTYLEKFTDITNSENYQFYLIIDFNIEKYKNKISEKVHILSGFDLLFYAYTSINSDSRTYANSSLNVKNTNNFLSYNGSLRENRVLLLLELLKRNIELINPNKVSFLFYQSNKEFNKNDYKQMLDSMYSNLDTRYCFTKEDVKILEEYSMPIINDEVTLNSIPNEVDGNYQPVLNVVTENTHGFENDDALSKYGITTFTEKTLKPFLARQIPLFIGPPNLEKELRNLGFDLFDDLIDYSFEEIENNYDRFQKKIDELERLLTIDMVLFKKNNITRFNNNRRLVTKLASDGYYRCYDFINNTLFE